MDTRHPQPGGLPGQTAGKNGQTGQDPLVGPGYSRFPGRYGGFNRPTPTVNTVLGHIKRAMCLRVPRSWFPPGLLTFTRLSRFARAA
jgi:hypothetical protein